MSIFEINKVFCAFSVKIADLNVEPDSEKWNLLKLCVLKAL